ncbi:MAG: glycosyltransferase [Planctomycetota bacterium]
MTQPTGAGPPQERPTRQGTTAPTDAPRIAYLASEYPSVTSSFIRREIAELRRRGLQIETMSIRRCRTPEALGRHEQDAARTTFVVLDAGVTGTIGALAWALTRHPLRLFRAGIAALHHRPAGLRPLLWAGFYLAEACVLARELERRGVGHLHNHFANAAANVGFLTQRLLAAPWSLTLHGNADFEGEHRDLLRDKIAACVFVGCISHYGKAQALRRAALADWDKVFVYGCGLDLAELERHRRAPVPGMVLCVGRLSAEKGQAGLLQAFAQLRTSNARLRLVGDGPERGPLTRLTERLGLTDRVEMLGSLPTDQALGEMSRAQLLVLTSFMEGIPVVLMEAMALGLCVIAPRLAGIPELVEHRVNGVLFTPAHWTELAHTIDELLTDHALRERLASAAQNGAGRRLSVEKAAAPLADCFVRRQFRVDAKPVRH